MIKLSDLLRGILYDPFTGDLQEGLTKTIPIGQAMEIMGREVENYPELDFINDSNSIILGFKPTYPSDLSSKYSTGTLYDPKIAKILTLANNLGYFPSMLKYELNNQAEQYTKKYTPSFFRNLISTIFKFQAPHFFTSSSFLFILFFCIFRGILFPRPSSNWDGVLE